MGKESIRSNRQIWRVAKFMFNAATIVGDGDFKDMRPWYRNRLYDKTAELLKKITNNEFTGRDNHED